MLKLIYCRRFCPFCCIHVSIHPMLKLILFSSTCFRLVWVGFNTSHVKVNLYFWLISVYVFQVSIHPMLKLIMNRMTGLYLVKCFNTSHVKVNPEDKYGIKCPYTSFNTSHVKVNPNINQDLERLNDSFNTSHVKVNRKSLSASSGSVLRVSIHPMLKLIPTFWHYSGRRMGVSIHPMLKLIAKRLLLN